MKHLVTLLFSLLVLTACQQEDKPQDAEKKSETPAVESKATDKTESNGIDNASNSDSEDKKMNLVETHDGHNHEHADAEPKEPYIEVESDATCESPVVYEFFAYHCPHCYTLETHAEKWREANKDKVKFVSVPTDLGHKQFASYLLVHHAAEKLGILDKTRHALFERFHKEKKLFASAEEATEFLVAQGADKDKAAEVLADMKAIGESIEADYKLMGKHKIMHVPQLLVNHKYMTDNTRAGGADKVFALVDELLAKESNCKPK